MQRSFLQLLVEGAPYSCYEGVLQAALDAAGSPAGIDAVKNEHQLALQLRELLESRRARQDALRALLECAKDLADVPDDVDTMLTSIVTRAHRLLGCDLAYLSLNDDERHGTYVRVMVGAIAAEWKDLLIPFGAGIGGMVAATAAPFATADYFADERLAHAPEVDASARAEEQVAILGVPLVHRTHVIGVLYASNRTPGRSRGTRSSFSVPSLPSPRSRSTRPGCCRTKQGPSRSCAVRIPTCATGPVTPSAPPRPTTG